MVRKSVVVDIESGIHARPAGVLAKEAMKCRSNVALYVGERKVNPKSVLNLMAAVIKNGTEITFECDGENEQQDLDALVAAVESGLGER